MNKLKQLLYKRRDDLPKSLALARKLLNASVLSSKENLPQILASAPVSPKLSKRAAKYYKHSWLWAIQKKRRYLLSNKFHQIPMSQMAFG